MTLTIKDCLEEAMYHLGEMDYSIEDHSQRAEHCKDAISDVALALEIYEHDFADKEPVRTKEVA